MTCCGGRAFTCRSPACCTPSCGLSVTARCRRICSGLHCPRRILPARLAQVYALALARSSDLEALALYSELIGGVQEELNLHRVYTAELAIDLGGVVPNPACRAYTDFLLRTAWHNSLGETLAAITPCMRLYAFLGEVLVPNCGPHHPYRKWMETYSAEEFRRLGGRLEAQLERVWR